METPSQDTAARRPSPFQALRALKWHSLFLLVIIAFPVLICFSISAAIEMLVFRSVLTGLGFQQIAVFLALSLETFKLIIPFILLQNARLHAAFQNAIAVFLRIVLVFISFSCTFIAISNNLVDANAEQIAARDNAIRAGVTQSFQEEYREKADAVNESADQEIALKRQVYDIPSKQQQLDALNATYAAGHDWATYGLIVEMNNAINQAQAALNQELNGIEAARAKKLAALGAQYSDAALQKKIGAELTRAASSTNYDQSQNTNITKVIYLIRSTLRLEMSYEAIVLLIAVLICFASECIIWTGSTSLAQRYQNRYGAEERDTFAEEVLRRALNRDKGGPDAEPDDIPKDATPLIVFDRALMKRLIRQERGRLERRMRLTLLREHYEYLHEKRRLRREAKRKKEEETA